MREPFSDLPNRITISNEEGQERETNVYGIGKCKYCGGTTLPMAYIGKIPSHFICQSCEIIQYNPSHPAHVDKKPHELLTVQESKLQNRRQPHDKIKIKGQKDEDPEESVQSIDEGKRSRFKKVSIIKETSDQKIQSMFEETIEFDPHSKISTSSQVEMGISRSLRNLSHQMKAKESSDEALVKEMMRSKNK